MLDKMIGTLSTKLPKTPNFVYRDNLTKNDKPTLPKKLQTSPQIIDIYRDQYFDGVTDLKQPLLSLDDIDHQEISYPKGKVLSTNNYNTSNSGDSTKSGNMRVKVLMTKKEAEILLSKCKGNNTLEFKHVMNELSKLPAQRIHVISSVLDVHPSWGTPTALPTIHEED